MRCNGVNIGFVLVFLFWWDESPSFSHPNKEQGASILVMESQSKHSQEVKEWRKKDFLPEADRGLW